MVFAGDAGDIGRVVWRNANEKIVKLVFFSFEENKIAVSYFDALNRYSVNFSNSAVRNLYIHELHFHFQYTKHISP